MEKTIWGAVLDRDTLAAGLTLPPAKLQRINLTSILIPPRGALVGYWDGRLDEILPHLLVVRDEDLSDTFAWLNSFLGGVSPITQWCRVLPHSALNAIANRSPRIGLGRRLGAWVGAIIAECNAQAGNQISLRELAGSAAMSSATYAAARATAIWGNSISLKELAQRHDTLTAYFRESGRGISAQQLLPLWDCLAQTEGPLTREQRSYLPLIELLNSSPDLSPSGEMSAQLEKIANLASGLFDLPILEECARGPQRERVRAFDALAIELSEGPKSIAIDGVVGFAASLIDPGSVVMPELLRKYTLRFPLCSIWLGAFAGAWAPSRVLADNQGLGRLLIKPLLSETDLESRPSCDVAYDELVRWIGPSTNRLALRGMHLRALTVEVSLGVNCPFSLGRSEPVKEAPRDQVSDKDRNASSTSRTIGHIAESLDNLTRRVAELEKRANAAQRELEFPENNSDTSKKMPARGRWKK